MSAEQRAAIRDEAVCLITRRLTEYQAAPVSERPDAEVWAQVLFSELAFLGLRPTETRPWEPRTGGASPASPETIRDRLIEMRAALQNPKEPPDMPTTRPPQEPTP
ncbi:hypothetical protein ACFVWN_20480 [Nocardiopsis flavescens]|uniref:hypothetical protein n=1 Tax=Nocardiopsis flavescens TaxID=758803 RepID=UPI00364BB31C